MSTSLPPSLSDLNAAAPGSIVETAATPQFPPLRYTKQANGNWYMRWAKNTPAGWLLDPEHSAHPIRWVHRA